MYISLEVSLYFTYYFIMFYLVDIFKEWLSIKESLANAGNVDSIPGLGRSPGGENGNPLQYSCLENLTDKGAWRAIVHVVTKSQT